MQVVDECNSALSWLADKSAQQAALNKFEEPVLVTADIQKKHDMIDRLCKPIMSKPAPKPEPAPAAPEAAPAAGPEPMQTEAAEAAGAQAEQPMEQ